MFAAIYIRCITKIPIGDFANHNGKCRYYSRSSRLSEAKIGDILMCNRYDRLNRFLILSRKAKILLSLLLLLLFSAPLFAQNNAEKQNKRVDFRIMFYNTENYFDPFDDSLTNDQEFLPDAMRHWNYKRFVHKRNDIYKTIMAVGDMEPPAIIGLCEIENRFVLNQLLYKTPLEKFDYRIIQQESPDHRGIDVALLFNPKILKVLDYDFIAINFPFSPETKTRDIIYVKALIEGQDSLHIFVNHWPSRYGGELSSAPRRAYVAKQLAKHIDILLQKNKKAKILVMGDFNDYPYNRSIRDVLNAGKDPQKNRLINLMPEHYHNLGTHKFHGEWGILDQFMVSPALLSADKGIFVEGEAHIFNADFLLTDDTKFLGKMPFRTYLGMKYQGGFSDHLPIYLDLRLK